MSFVQNPMALLAQHFPQVPYSLEVPPDASDNGSRPLADTLALASTRLAQFSADVLLLKSQMTVQEASGPYLDLHGAEYGVKRFLEPFELDELYRQRILARKYKLTLPAIAAVVKAFYISTLPANQQPTVLVYDLQSDPPRAAAAGLVMFQFAIDISYQILASSVFFAGRSFLGRKSYVINPGSIDNAPPSDLLKTEVDAVRAANTEPVWFVRRGIVSAYS